MTTIITSNVSDDTYASPAILFPSDNTHGSEHTIKVSKVFLTSTVGFVRFDVPGQLNGRIVSASLRLHIKSVTAQGDISFHVINEEWNEESVSSSNLPSYSEIALANTTVTTTGSKFIDITEIAKIWATNPASNHGLAMVSEGGNIEIESKEAPEHNEMYVNFHVKPDIKIYRYKHNIPKVEPGQSFHYEHYGFDEEDVAISGGASISMAFGENGEQLQDPGLVLAESMPVRRTSEPSLGWRIKYYNTTNITFTGGFVSVYVICRPDVLVSGEVIG